MELENLTDPHFQKFKIRILLDKTLVLVKNKVLQLKNLKN